MHTRNSPSSFILTKDDADSGHCFTVFFQLGKNLLTSNCKKDLAMIPTSVRYSNPQVWPELCTVSTSSLQRQENPLWTASDGLSTGLGHRRWHQGCALPYGLVGRKPNASFLVSGTQGSLKEARIQHIPLQSL